MARSVFVGARQGTGGVEQVVGRVLAALLRCVGEHLGGPLEVPCLVQRPAASVERFGLAHPRSVGPVDGGDLALHELDLSGARHGQGALVALALGQGAFGRELLEPRVHVAGEVCRRSKRRQPAQLGRRDVGGALLLGDGRAGVSCRDLVLRGAALLGLCGARETHRAVGRLPRVVELAGAFPRQGSLGEPGRGVLALEVLRRRVERARLGLGFGALVGNLGREHRQLFLQILQQADRRGVVPEGPRHPGTRKAHLGPVPLRAQGIDQLRRLLPLLQPNGLGPLAGLDLGHRSAGVRRRSRRFRHARGGLGGRGRGARPAGTRRPPDGESRADPEPPHHPPYLARPGKPAEKPRGHQP
jgi:hypothetical protein